MSHFINQTIIRFPEINLETRDAHKLRGYFGTLFQEHSPLLHNHLATGENAYRYPLVQYKVIAGVPTLVGLNEGADLLIGLFLKIRELQIAGRSYPVLQKNIESKMTDIGLTDDLYSYRFETLWMALSQRNHAEYLAEPEEQKTKHLKAILTGNILSFLKAMNYRAEAPVLVNLKIIDERKTQFKSNTMLAFQATFVTNILLPEYIGLGKSVSRGFGTITLNN